MKLQRHTLHNRPQAGFSLAELMVVIVIIGLLSTVVAPKLFDKLGKANVSAAKSNMVVMIREVDNFRLNTGELPDSLEQLVEADDKGTKYLNTRVVPKDPWGNDFTLETDEFGDPIIWCLGKDGVQGGEDDDMDFSTHMIADGEI